MNRQYPCILELSNGIKYILLENPRKSCPHLMLRLDGELTTQQEVRDIIRFIVLEKFDSASKHLHGFSMMTWTD